MANGGSTAQKVVTFARGKAGQQVGSGECYDLADKALRSAGAKSAPDFGQITDDADYEWGDLVDAKDAQPGDIVQFRDYVVTKETHVVRRTTEKDGSWKEEDETRTETRDRPHHTAVVDAVDGVGNLTVLEQNVAAPGGSTPIKRVQRNTLPTKSSSKPPVKTTKNSAGRVVTVTTTVTISVEGTVWVYRPTR